MVYVFVDRLFVVLTLPRRHMFALAAIVGVISYVVFGLGVAAKLQPPILATIVIGSVTMLVWWMRIKLKIHHYLPKLSWIETCLLILIFAQLLINLFGALGPELGFDALWYHLTLPKIYLEQAKVFYFPGSLFAYSAMPKLAEMVYLLGLWAHGAVIAKLINYSFGVLILVSLYRLARTYLSRTYALLTVLVFSSNLVFAWQSITAYVDLARTWFEVLALLAWVTFTQKENTYWLAICGVMVGLATATKMIGLSSLLIFAVMLLMNNRRSIKNLIALVLPAILIPLPWFVFAFIGTGNPIFPVFSPLISFSISMPHIPYRLEDFKQLRLLFFRSSDPLSPMYAMVFPFIFIVRKKIGLAHPIMLYSFLSLLLWFHLPKDGGARFALAYLPIWSLTAVLIIHAIQQKFVRAVLLGSVITIAMITIAYRGAANAKYLPVILGKETERHFLMTHLNFTFGDFYDEDGAIKKIVGDTPVLIMGGHNLFYADFRFVHEATLKSAGEAYQFSYILTLDKGLPDQFSTYRLVYENPTTKAKLFKRSSL